MVGDGTDRRGGATTLGEVLVALDGAVAALLSAPAGETVELSSVALVDAADLRLETDAQAELRDVYLQIGVDEQAAVCWLDDVAQRAATTGPRVVMSKIARESAHLRRAARDGGVAVVAINPEARWDHVFAVVQRAITHGMQRQQSVMLGYDVAATDTDLFELARIVAHNAGGMVSIEDAQSQVLAYSASDESADALRTLSILGREGPREYLQVLREWGVFDKLRNGDGVIDVPAHDKLGIKRRLVVSIRQPSTGPTAIPRLLGSIWVQQGAAPFADNAAEVLRGASAMAARVIIGALDAPSTEAVLIERLFGARGGGVDVAAVANALRIPLGGPCAVIGLAATPTATHAQPAPLADVGSTLRLLASSFRRDAVATVIGDRAYVLLPRYKSVHGVTTWTRHLVDHIEASRALVLRAAIVAPVEDLGQVAGARIEVDRVLDGTAETFPNGRVTTLAESRTAVLLAELLTLMSEHPHLRDPRLDDLVDYDAGHAGDLRVSAEAYFAHHHDVRSAADALKVHPNTLRYRLRRIEEIVGLRLDDVADRLLFELQLALRRRIEGADVRP